MAAQAVTVGMCSVKLLNNQLQLVCIICQVGSCHLRVSCRFGQEQQQAAQANSQPQPVLQYSRLPDASLQQITNQSATADAPTNASAQLSQGSLLQPAASTADPIELEPSAAATLEPQNRVKPDESALAMPIGLVEHGANSYYDEQAAMLQQQPARVQKPAQHMLSEREQQGSTAGKGPSQPALSPGQPDLQAQSMHPQGMRHAAQRPLSELEQQGSIPVLMAPEQGIQHQSLPRSVSPHELDHVAALEPVNRRSPTRDLTEIEQQGSFRLASSFSQNELSNQHEGASQAQSTQGIAAAELALDLARRKAAQAELERQYSALQLQHQQVTLCAVSVFQYSFLFH